MHMDITLPGAARAAAGVSTQIKLCAGTTVLTLDGEMAVESLRSGARVITRDSGMAVLQGVDKIRAVITPIKIKAGSLGHTRPDRDTQVPDTTPIHIRDWRAPALYGTANAMVPAVELTDGEFITKQAETEVRIVTLTFARPHVIYADGLEIGCA